MPGFAVVIDDDSTLRGLVGDLLKMLGYEVVAARDGDEGWEMICSFKPVLVVTDEGMPGKKGHDIHQLIGNFFPDTACVVMSGWDLTQAGAEAWGIRVFLPKPFSIEDFTQAVKQATKTD